MQQIPDRGCCEEIMFTEIKRMQTQHLFSWTTHQQLLLLPLAPCQDQTIFSDLLCRLGVQPVLPLIKQGFLQISLFTRHTSLHRCKIESWLGLGGILAGMLSFLSGHSIPGNELQLHCKGASIIKRYQGKAFHDGRCDSRSTACPDTW